MYHRVLEDFSRRLVTIVDLNRLLNMLGQTIEQSMGVKSILVFLYNPEKDNFRPAFLKNPDPAFADSLALNKDFALIQYLEEKKQVFVRAELVGLQKNNQHDALLKALSQIEAEVCLPLIYLDRIIGFICLGTRKMRSCIIVKTWILLGIFGEPNCHGH